MHTQAESPYSRPGYLQSVPIEMPNCGTRSAAGEPSPLNTYHLEHYEFEERKIGNTVFLVFANGMVPADDVAQLRRDADGYCIALKSSGWVIMKPLAKPMKV